MIEHGDSDDIADAQPTLPEARRRLEEIARQNTSFEQKAREALELGTAYLGVDSGYIVLTDEETEHWNAIISDGSSASPPTKTRVDLNATYCRHTIESGDQLALHDAPSQGTPDEQAFQPDGIECYLGTPLVVDGTQSGAVCFVAEDPREEPFGETDTLFTDLLTQMLGYEQETEQNELALRRQAGLANVLNRILRHNLRNRLTVIRGHTSMIADKLESGTNTEPIFESIDRLGKLSDKARGLESVIEQSADRELTNITALVKRIRNEVMDATDSTTITVECDEEITTVVRTNFEEGLRELVENAAKHAGDRSNVSVTVVQVGNNIVIQITDDGPGLPAQEQAVLANDGETPLVHGTGLGLWLANWIITSHGGTIEPDVSDIGTTITVTIPRSPPSQRTALPTELLELPKATATTVSRSDSPP